MTDTFSYNLQRTARSLNDSTAQYPTMEVTTSEPKYAKYYRRAVGEMAFEPITEHRGVVRSYSVTNYTASTSLDSEYLRFTETMLLMPFYGRLDQFVHNICSTGFGYTGPVGTFATFLSDEDAGRMVGFAGGEVSLWDTLSSILTSFGLAISFPTTGVKLTIYRDRLARNEVLRNFATSYTENLDFSDAARKIKVSYDNWYYVNEGIVPFDESSSKTVLQVEANETIEQTLTVNGFITGARWGGIYPWFGAAGSSVNMLKQLGQSAWQLSSCNETLPYAPTARYLLANYMPWGYSSCYCVSGQDGLPIKPAQWYDNGGYLRWRINEKDTSQIIVKVHGANIPDLAPFHIGMSSGSNTYYPGLYFVVAGYYRERKEGDKPSFTLDTGVSSNAYQTIEVENDFIRTREQAVRTAFNIAATHSGVPKVSITLPGPDLYDQDPDLLTFSKYESLINTGLVWGQDVVEPRSVTITQDSVTVEGQYFTRVSDFNALCKDTETVGNNHLPYQVDEKIRNFNTEEGEFVVE